jgi:hypothetical protein
MLAVTTVLSIYVGHSLPWATNRTFLPWGNCGAFFLRESRLVEKTFTLYIRMESLIAERVEMD